MSEAILNAMRQHLHGAKKEGLTPVALHLSDALAREIAVASARPAKLLGLRVVIHDEWAWGWMMSAKRHVYDFDSSASFWSPSQPTREVA